MNWPGIAKAYHLSLLLDTVLFFRRLKHTPTTSSKSLEKRRSRISRRSRWSVQWQNNSPSMPTCIYNAPYGQVHSVRGSKLDRKAASLSCGPDPVSAIARFFKSRDSKTTILNIFLEMLLTSLGTDLTFARRLDLTQSFNLNFDVNTKNQWRQGQISYSSLDY